MRQRPAIAISSNVFPAEERRFYKGKALQYSEHAMVRAVADAGGLPFVLVDPTGSPSAVAAPDADELEAYCAAMAARTDALILSGGEDVSPTHYGEAPGAPEWAGNPSRDAFEIAAYRAFIAAGKPILGICRGAQIIAVAEGGRLYQDLATLGPADALTHRSQDLYDQLGHGIALEAGSFLTGGWSGDELYVNSVHHQAVASLPPTLRPLAFAPDGVIEAFERRESGPFVAGVQWHPEWMQDRAGQRAIFKHIVGVAMNHGGDSGVSR